MCGGTERGVVAQDLGLERAQVGARLEPELVDQVLSQLTERAQRLGLSPRAIKGQDALLPQALSEGVGAG